MLVATLAPGCRGAVAQTAQIQMPDGYAMRLAPLDLPSEAATTRPERAAAALWLATLPAAFGIAASVWFVRRRFTRLRLAADRRFARLAEQAGDLVLHLRGDAIVFCADRLLGCDAAQRSALRLRDFVHPLDLEPVEAALEGLAGEAVAGRLALTFRLRHRNGSTLWVEGLFSRLDDDTGGADLMIAMRDVTRQREDGERSGAALDAARDAQKAADEASRVKGDFLASMSHEIRTPLNAIIGFADLLLAARDLGSANRRSVERIRAGGDALLTIVNDVLDFSQLESGALRLRAEPFVLPLLIDECIALVERPALAKALSLRVELLDHFPAGVLGDAARLRQVVLNLVNNAIKFTPQGSVTLRLRYQRAAGPDRILFEVEDTGIGISSEDLPTLFHRFRQLDGTARRSYGGTGLGLAISKMLVERMGGAIGARSVNGSGSTFWFALDLPAAPLMIEAAVPAAPACRALRILLVEDIRVNQELARAILEARGHDIDVVCDGAEAIMAVENESYDLVLMDVQMPHVDGITATRAIRSLPVPGRFVPIVAMTANVLRDQVAAVLAAGMDEVLGKPLSLEAIDALLERAGRDEVRAALDPAALDRGVLVALARIVGETKADGLLGAFGASLVQRFLEPQGLPALKAQAQASIAAATMLGFRRFAALCQQVVEVDEMPASLHGELLGELGQVVRLCASLRGESQGGKRRAA